MEVVLGISCLAVRFQFWTTSWPGGLKENHDWEVSMAIPLDPKQVVSFEELLMSQVVQQEALTRLLIEKGIFSKEEFLEIVNIIDREMKKERKGN